MEDESSLYDKFAELLNTGLEGYKAYTNEQLAEANEELADKLAAQQRTNSALPSWALPAGIGAVILLVVALILGGRK